MAILAILSDKMLLSKKIDKFIRVKISKGRNMVPIVTVGNLYSGK